MILVDSSVLVAFLRGDGRREVVHLKEALDQGLRVGLEPHVYQEVLQGARDEGEWKRLDAYLSTQVVYGVRHGLRSQRDAARIYYDARRRGLTVRSLVDCLVAQTALENDVALLALDRDYDSIAAVRPLRLWRSH